MTKAAIKVGMADLKHTRHPGVLFTLGLGSCAGIALYDKTTKMIGLAHIMLPWSHQVRNSSNAAKFADTGINLLLNNMLDSGAVKNTIVAKLAGGAQMFKFTSGNDMMRIGQRNIEAAKQVLHQLSIPIISEDTGGDYGRTIEFYSEDGRLLIKAIGYDAKYI
jgi:chemotaxis protein CheD